jgi:monoamine oxidase
LKDEINRRDFMRRGLLAAAAMPFASLDASAQTPLRRRGAPKRVVVLGAGLAGLAAAFELERTGHAVTVLEARTRAGGRVRTLREQFSHGLYAEAGAQFVPASHALTVHYARLFRLRLRPLVPSRLPTLYSVRGRVVKTGRGVRAPEWPLELTDEERRLGPDGVLEKYAGAVVKGIGKEAAALTWPPEPLKRYDRMSFADFLRERGASRAAVALLEMGYAGINGDGLESFSALSGLRDLALGHDDTEYKIEGGTDLLPRAFAQRLGASIDYGSAVVRVEQDERGTSVVYSKAGTPLRVAADRVVCTLPFTTLRRVRFGPRLSREKERAIQELPLTSVVRTYLQTRRKVWRDAGLSGEVLIDEPRAWLAPLDHAGPRDILESFVTGPHARRLSGLVEGERVHTALADAGRFFPSMRLNFEGGASYDWDADEWAHGGWTWYKPGQMTELLPHAARAEGRIHFAGEHTSAWPGWMQGALHSGLRAAREANDAP